MIGQLLNHVQSWQSKRLRNQLVQRGILRRREQMLTQQRRATDLKPDDLRPVSHKPDER